MTLKNEITDLISPHWEEMHFSLEQRDLFIEYFIKNKPEFILETGFATGTSALTMCYASRVINGSERFPIKAISVALQEGDYKAKVDLKFWQYAVKSKEAREEGGRSNPKAFYLEYIPHKVSVYLTRVGGEWRINDVKD